MQINRFTIGVAAIVLLALPLHSHAWPRVGASAGQGEQQASGMVTGVADGDTLYVDLNGKSTRVRLAEIDAPEKKQAYGRLSEQSLRELVAKRQVSLTWRKIDQYGRPVVHVRVAGVDVNTEQVRRGYAWVYRQYSSDSRLVLIESQAKAAGLGLWADPHPVAPWEWRHAGRAQKD
ncbi:MAG: thermonuclease family protein [Pseudomonas sp.]|nr:MAG: thermonuclease family protein [Pseudomonas sp.]